MLIKKCFLDIISAQKDRYAVMLLEFKCKNFRSIKDEIVFSLLASSDNTNADFSIVDKGDFKVLKKAIIYGANGSGKTNFVKALYFLKALVVNSQNHMPNSSILAQPHKKAIEEDTSFIIQFIDRKENRYTYTVSFNANRVSSEALYNYPNGRITKIFSRDGTEISSNSYKSQFSFVAGQTLKENRLFLSCAAKDSNVDVITDVYTFFDKDLVFYPNLNPDNPNANWRIYSAQTAERNPLLKDLFVQFNQQLGVSALKDIKSTVVVKKMEAGMIPPFINEEFKKTMLEQTLTETIVNYVYSDFPIRLEDESLGNQKLFEMFFPIIDVLRNGRVFICDEFERSLHPLVVQKLIEIAAHNNSGAQFILTTHDVGLLNPSIFRRDEIWFTDMKEDSRSTDMYSLAELKSIRKGEIYSRNYIMGKYSSIPVISSNIEDLFIGDKND